MRHGWQGIIFSIQKGFVRNTRPFKHTEQSYTYTAHSHEYLLLLLFRQQCVWKSSRVYKALFRKRANLCFFCFASCSCERALARLLSGVQKCRSFVSGAVRWRVARLFSGPRLEQICLRFCMHMMVIVCLAEIASKTNKS